MKQKTILPQLIITLTILLTMALTSCTAEKPELNSDNLPPMYPDYTNVTIPPNIAPLNFLMPDSVQKVEVYADGERIHSTRSNKVTFGNRRWRRLLKEHQGDSIEILVRATFKDCVTEYAPFHWYVATDEVDPYLTYRLIEPDYEVFSRIALEERCVENFKTRRFADHEKVGNRCMNCHTYASQDPQLSMLYVRGTSGGAVLNRSGKLSLLDINSPGMVSSSVYFNFHPSGRYIVFSSNHIIPAFHSSGSKRLEVFDVASDVYVADLEQKTIVTNDLLCDSMQLETFPTFSPDGKYIYYCSADAAPIKSAEAAQKEGADINGSIKQIKYYLCRVSFANGRLGDVVDTLSQAGVSVCHPRISPDGKLLLYTTQDYGTFPIWHREADLRMMNLETMIVDSMNIVNSDMSDTYHSWSSNSRWFVFASKRDDGLYGKPYFCYVDRQGVCHKPFVLPQRDPEFYGNCLKSFNAPELGKGQLPFGSEEIVKLLKSTTAVKFNALPRTPSQSATEGDTP